MDIKPSISQHNTNNGCAKTGNAVITLKISNYCIGSKGCCKQATRKAIQTIGNIYGICGRNYYCNKQRYVEPANTEVPDRRYVNNAYAKFIIKISGAQNCHQSN